VLRVVKLVLEHAEFGDDVDVGGFGECLKSALQDSLRLCELTLVLLFLITHVEEEFDVARPNLDTFKVLLAKFLVNVFH